MMEEMAARMLIERVRQNGIGEFLSDKDETKFSSINGADVAQWLCKQGYTILEYKYDGGNGIAITTCGMKISTNGYVSKVKK